MPASAKTRGVGRETVTRDRKTTEKNYWTRERVIAAIRRWVELYGEPPRSADWNPSSAKWSGQMWRVPRYELGDPETGDPWPALNSAKRPFGGSLNAAIEAAGFDPNRPGPPSRRKGASPELDEHLDAHPRVKAALRAARSEVNDLAEKVEVRDRQLSEARRVRDRLKEELAEARKARKTITKTKTKTKVKVVKERDLASLRASKAQTREARLTATRLAARLERAEATINTLRAEKAELKAEILRQSQRAYGAEERARLLAETEAVGEVREVEVVREVEKVVERVVEMPAPEQAVVDGALRDAMLARRDAAAAEKRAEASDRAYFELAAAVKGEPRRLTVAELRELRRSGPAGSAVLAAALKGLARARAGDGDLRAALSEIASAALSWGDRIR